MVTQGIKGTSPFPIIRDEPCICGSPIIYVRNRDRASKRYCSTACKHADMKGHAPNMPEFREARICEQCDSQYLATAKNQRYCNRQCSEKVNAPLRLARVTVSQYLHRLVISRKDRKAHLTAAFLLTIYERQKGRCALTGLEMTWDAGRGRLGANISIDRINSFGGYTRDNVQLVCLSANYAKHALSQADFVALCRLVVGVADARTD